MQTRAATGRLRQSSAMQPDHIGAEDKNKKTARHLLVDLSAIAFSDWNAARDGRTGGCGSFPSWLSQRRGGRPNPRYTKVQIVTCFVVASFTCVQLSCLPTGGIQAARNPSFWVTHAWHRDSQEPEIRSFRTFDCREDTSA